MRRVILAIFIVGALSSNVYGQERLFSLGYGRTFVTDDSTTFNITFDLNRVPAQSERAGGYFFVNEVIKKSKWGYFVKPTMDVNIGSSVTSAPNNISVGLPVGLVYDIKKKMNSIGTFSCYIEGSPDLVADKSFTNNLYYYSMSTYFKYELLSNKILLNIITGLSNANGLRYQTSTSKKQIDKYGRNTIPVYLKIVTWNASNKRTVNGVDRGKEFKRIHWANSIKINHVYSDNETINKESNYTFFNSKLDFYMTPNLAINITYFNGNEEPIFKRNNSIIFGLTLAR